MVLVINIFLPGVDTDVQLRKRLSSKLDGNTELVVDRFLQCFTIDDKEMQRCGKAIAKSIIRLSAGRIQNGALEYLENTRNLDYQEQIRRILVVSRCNMSDVLLALTPDTYISMIVAGIGFFRNKEEFTHELNVFMRTFISEIKQSLKEDANVFIYKSPNRQQVLHLELIPYL